MRPPLNKEEARAGRAEAGREALRQLTPWEGSPSRTDKALGVTVLAVFAYWLALTPLKPFLIGRNPVLLELIAGGNAAVGAAAAFARIGQAPLWLVVLAGVVGSAKFDWLFWWMGQRWGGRIVRMFLPNPRMQERVVERVQDLPRWVAPVAVLVAMLPGVPAAAAFAFAGWRKLSLPAFLALDLLGTGLWVGLVAALGYAAGQAAVDLVLLVDEYALWVSLALIVVTSFWSARRRRRQPPAPGAAGQD